VTPERFEQIQNAIPFLHGSAQWELVTALREAREEIKQLSAEHYVGFEASGKEWLRLRAIEDAAGAHVKMERAGDFGESAVTFQGLADLVDPPPVRPEPRVGMKVRATKENWERWPWNAEIIGKDLDGHWLVRDCQNVVAPLGIVWEEDR
jgi:hypothetical protein